MSSLIFQITDYSLFLNIYSCNGPIQHIQESIPDLYSVSVMIGPNLDMDTANSVLMKADDQVQ